LKNWSQEEERIIHEVLPSLRKELGAWIMYRDSEALRILKQKHKSRTDANRATSDPNRKADFVV